MRLRVVEGVDYYPHVVRYRLTDGSRRQRTFWSPGAPFVRVEVARALADIVGLANIRPRSVTIRRVIR